MSDSVFPLLISPAVFAEFLRTDNSRENIRIVDLSSEANFIQGHIPGAVHLPSQALVSGQAPASGKLPSLERLTEIFSYLGLDQNTRFVVCDDEGGGWAGRFIWTLDVIGHQHYSYIDGGMIAWKSEGLDVETGTGDYSPNNPNTPLLTIDPAPIKNLDDILEGLNQNKFLIWDARGPDEYHGRKVVASRGGHIPGAINVEWTSLMDVSRGHRIRRDAREYLQKFGIDGRLPVVTHCQTHHRSGFTYLVGKVLGFNISAYDGSWSEWGNHPNTPIEI